MQSYGEWQSEFARALMHPDLPVPPGLTDPFGRTGFRRFAIYRNNVVAGLIEALEDSFPVTCRIVGAEFFKAMARIYVAHNPPDSPILLEYGRGFAAFVAHFEPASALPYLGDVCRIERAWLDAYHAPDASPMERTALAAFPPELILGMCVKLHPSLRLVRSSFPALTIWETNTENGTPCPVELEGNPEFALIVRPRAEVEVHSLSQPEFVFVEALSAERTILQASHIAAQSDQVFDTRAALAGIVELGLVADVYDPTSSDVAGQGVKL